MLTDFIEATPVVYVGSDEADVFAYLLEREGSESDFDYVQAGIPTSWYDEFESTSREVFFDSVPVYCRGKVYTYIFAAHTITGDSFEEEVHFLIDGNSADIEAFFNRFDAHVRSVRGG